MSDKQARRHSQAFRDWTESIRPAVLELSPEVGSRYSDPDRWRHYVDTGLTFVESIPTVREVAQAGFLHGVWETSLVRQLDLHPDVEAILASQRRLWSIDRLDADVPEHLMTSVLPTLTHAAGALLLVVEQLLHLDADGVLAAHTARFRRGPSPLRRAVRTAKAIAGTQLPFLKYVVIPTAEFFGLWNYRNVAEDLLLYHSDRQRFDALLEFVLRSVRDVEPVVREEGIRKFIGRESCDIFWEWHHLGSLNRILSGSPTTWASRIGRCGRVTVACQEPEDCYALLAKLHLAAHTEHQVEIDDFISMPRASGYQAIHTTIWPSGTDRLSPESVRIRILTREMHLDRQGPVDGRRLALMQRQIEARRLRGLQVFANDGKSVLLPAGSIVLNFAYAVHNDFVALARGARVNKAPVDLLHPLREGDVVDLIVSDTPQPLPPGWDKKAPPESIKRIRAKFNAVYRPHQIDSGRRVLRQLLGERNVRVATRPLTLDDATLDAVTEDAIASLRTKGHRLGLTAPADFLRKIGDAHQKSGKDIPESFRHDLVIDEVASRLRASRSLPIEDFVLPKEMIGSFEMLVLCPHCQPTPGKDVVGCLVHRRLVVHQAHRKCAEDGTPISWRRRFSRGQYFVVEMNNRQGIASEILTQVAARGIDLQDHVGASLGPGWAVLRFHVHSLPEAVVRELTNLIAGIPGVIRVLGPESKPVQALEGPLPPRERRTMATQTASPYLCGPVIMDDRYFYGRDRELSNLRSLFDQIRFSGDRRGMNIFVHGPLKTGKTSLVERFLRELRRTEYRSIIAKSTAMYNEGWRSVAERLRDDLAHNLKLSEVSGISPQVAKELSLEDLLSLLRNASDLPVVLVIDEAVSMFLSISNGSEEAALANFFSKIAMVSGVAAIWIGPEAPVNDLSLNLQAAIRTAQPLRMQPLGPTDVIRLMRAQNLEGSGIEIQADDKLGVELARFTGGNPYWCNLSAEAMFTNADVATAGAALVYSRLHLAHACKELVQRGFPFADRVAELDKGSPMRGLVGLTLRLLAQADVVGKALTDEQLRAAASLNHVEIGEDAMRTLLLRLLARGSVRRRATKGETRWEIDCPALRHHVLNELRPVKGDV